MTGQPPYKVDEEWLRRSATEIIRALPLDERAATAEEAVAKLVSELRTRSGAAVAYLQEQRDAVVADGSTADLGEMDAQLFVGRQWDGLLSRLGTALLERERARFKAEERQADVRNAAANEVLAR